MSDLPAPPEALTEREQNTVLTPEQPWSDSYALKVSLADFQQAENYRMPHERRWRDADITYLAWVNPRVWDGTRVPRASLGVYLAFQQVESLLPQVLSAIFSDPQWADAQALPGTTAEEARETRDLILYQLRATDESGIPINREVARLALKSAYIRGNGFVELGWLEKELEVIRKVRAMRPIRRKVTTIFGERDMPVGQEPTIIDVKQKQKISRPELKYNSIWDVYVDPNCGSPVLQGTHTDAPARFTAKRALVTVDEINEYRNHPDFDLPPMADLLLMAKNHPSTTGEQAKRTVDTIRGNNWNPQEDSSVDPAAKRLEVISYQTAHRNVWILDRRFTCYNKPNPFGMITRFNAFYTDVLDRLYGLAVTDVVEGEQRLQEGLINGRLDEVALKIHPPEWQRRGLNWNAWQQRHRPGRKIEVESKDDFGYVEIGDILPEAYVEVGASGMRAQKTTGVTDLASLGVPSEQGNSAARTATGSSIQAGATKTRVEYLVENTCDTFLVPLLHCVHRMNKAMLDPMEVMQIINHENDVTPVDPLNVINSNVCFYVRAASRMRARLAMQNLLPQFMQYAFNPEFMKLLGSQYGLKINVLEIIQAMFDSGGYAAREDWLQKMSPEELQRIMQPPAEEMIRAQMQRERIEGQAGEGQENRSAELMKVVVKALFDAASKEKDEKEKENEPKKKENAA